MKRSAIRDRGGAVAHPRHPCHALRLPRFDAVRAPDPGFRDAASGLRQASPRFHPVGWGRRLTAGRRKKPAMAVSVGGRR